MEKMLQDFQQKLRKFSLGKRKFLLDKLNVSFSQNDEDIKQQFIYVASLLIDEKKTLKEAAFLSQNCFSVTSAQYEHYLSILNLYEKSLTDVGRRRFCSSVMKKTSQKTLAISAKIRQNTRH